MAASDGINVTRSIRQPCDNHPMSLKTGTLRLPLHNNFSFTSHSSGWFFDQRKDKETRETPQHFHVRTHRHFALTRRGLSGTHSARVLGFPQSIERASERLISSGHFTFRIIPSATSPPPARPSTLSVGIVGGATGETGVSNSGSKSHTTGLHSADRRIHFSDFRPHFSSHWSILHPNPHSGWVRLGRVYGIAFFGQGVGCRNIGWLFSDFIF